jgi:phage tail-like protein
MPAEIRAAGVAGGAPPSASSRGYLRRGLPGVYHDPPRGATGGAFATRFLLGLEEVLDPIVATIDLLPAHLDLDLAPPEVVELVASWLGVELDAGLTDAAHRRLVQHATEVLPARGTRPGLERTLALAFGRSDIEVRDGGGVSWGEGQGARPAGDPTVTVTLPGGMTPVERAALGRVVEEVRPAHVTVVLRDAEGAAG